MSRSLALLAKCTASLPFGYRQARFFRFADAPGYASLAIGVALLENGDSVIGHNFLAFDIPRLIKYHKAKIDGNKVCDTLLATRILWPDLRDSDAAANTIPVREYGKHSLRSWGHRLNCQKGDFSEWGQFSTTMMEYCVNDCITTWALYEHIRDATDRTGL
jgi:hypothetical protein